MRLRLTIHDQNYDITCDEARAPRTLARLAGCLPYPLQLHTPKIAGSHIYWDGPFVEDAEGGVDIHSAKPGAFLYWPVRQFVEIIYAPLQAETASVTLLGHYDGPVERIEEMAKRLREQQGVRLFDGQLSILDLGGITPTESVNDASLPAGLIAARDRVWASCPSDISQLRDSRALMHPAGPVFLAESEARVLHEMGWWLRERLATDDERDLRYSGALTVNKCATRLRDFCHMSTTANALFELEAAYKNAEVKLAPLVELHILLAGRIAAWCDLLIPWNPVNEAFREAMRTE